MLKALLKVSRIDFRFLLLLRLFVALSSDRCLLRSTNRHDRVYIGGASELVRVVKTAVFNGILAL